MWTVCNGYDCLLYGTPRNIRRAIQQLIRVDLPRTRYSEDGRGRARGCSVASEGEVGEVFGSST